MNRARPMAAAAVPPVAPGVQQPPAGPVPAGSGQAPPIESTVDELGAVLATVPSGGC
jgi:hypothetical protein